jgi:hypothetical protein
LFDRFTEQARRVLVLAERESARAGHDAIDTGDLVVALADEDTGIAHEALTTAGGAAGRGLAAINRATPVSAPSSASGLADDARAALQTAVEQALIDTQAGVSTGHLLVAILDQHDNRARQLLEQVGIKPDALRDSVLVLLKEGRRDGPSAGPLSPSVVAPALLAAWDAPQEVTNALATASASDDSRLQWLLADWLVRACVPAWLLAAGLDTTADRLQALGPITSPVTAEAAAECIDEAAAALADIVPGAIPESRRPTVADELLRIRTASGERGAKAALALDLPEGVTSAAADGVRRATAELVLRTSGDDRTPGLWVRAVTAARHAAEGEGRTGAGTRPGTGRATAMRVMHMAAGSVAIPLSMLESGMRSARARRLRDRIDSQAVRAALSASCGQLVDDAGWIVAGAGTDITVATAPLVADLRDGLSAALAGDVLL